MDGPEEGVHPRACGGNVHGMNTQMVASGPSPRVRGKPRRHHRGRRCEGSIPARAGETGSCPCISTINTVHPRACGGNLPGTVLSVTGHGPSPRVRGKHPVSVSRRVQRGSIPARAGETGLALTYGIWSRVHPRACGGKRLGRPLRPSDRGVHPRACGGNILAYDQATLIKGPSPRVRGKRSPSGADELRDGSIPARAGETALLIRRRRLWTVHPRACGGNC